MTGPRQVRRIAHKAARLLARDGYGKRPERRRRRGDVDAAYFCPSCLKVAYRRAAAAEAVRDAMAVDDPNADRLNVYDCPYGQHFHVGHRPANAVTGAAANLTRKGARGQEVDRD